MEAFLTFLACSTILLFDPRGAPSFRPDHPHNAAARRPGQGRPLGRRRLALDRVEHGGMLVQ
jgi:hypothetical protein